VKVSDSYKKRIGVIYWHVAACEPFITTIHLNEWELSSQGYSKHNLAK